MVMLHRFVGTDVVGRSWGFGWHSNTAASLATSHGNAVNFANNLWNGVGGAVGIKSAFNPATELTTVTTYQLQTVPPYKSAAALRTTVTLAGTAAGNALPQQCSILCGFTTPQTGRDQRGRFYFPATSTDTLTALGAFDTIFQGHFQASLLQAFTAAVAAGEIPVIFHKALGTMDLITEGNVPDKFDTQRRRVAAVVPGRLPFTMP